MAAILGVGYYGMSFMTDTMMKHRSARKNMMTFEAAEKKFGLNLKPKEERNIPGLWSPSLVIHLTLRLNVLTLSKPRRKNSNIRNP